MHFADWFLRSFRKHAPRFSCRFLSISSTSENFGQNSCRIRAESVSKFVRRGRVGGAKKSVRCGPGEWGGNACVDPCQGSQWECRELGGRGGPGEWRGTRAGGGPGVWGGAGAVRSSDLSCVCVCAEVGSKHRAKMFLQWPLGFVSGLMGF